MNRARTHIKCTWLNNEKVKHSVHTWLIGTAASCCCCCCCLFFFILVSFLSVSRFSSTGCLSGGINTRHGIFFLCTIGGCRQLLLYFYCIFGFFFSLSHYLSLSFSSPFISSVKGDFIPLCVCRFFVSRCIAALFIHVTQHIDGVC